MKIWNYIVIFSVMIIILEFMGLPTGMSPTLNQFGIVVNAEAGTVGSDLVNSTQYLFIINTLLALSVGAVIVGFFTKQFDTRLATLPIITTVFVIFASTGWSLIKYVGTVGEPWAVGIIATIFAPLGIGYILSIVDYFNGYQ